ncbi:MAG: HEAT repeat domain-containing protein, partial [Planctomycetia bacterium]|nr:HEAT repeat domain-containing protein [Planctomycetia bacterium]
MRRAITVLLIVGILAVVVGADESSRYRGQTTAQWLQQLSHPSPSARAAAAQAFVMIGKGNEDAAEPLIGLLADRDARVRFYAAYALGKIETHREQCIAALVKALPDTDEHVRYNAQWSLAQIAKQIAESKDDTTFANHELVHLLTEAETQLLVAGARPGHLKEIRAAIARFDQPAPPAVALMPPVAAAPDESEEISRCLEAMASEDLYTKLKAIETLRKLGPNGVQRLLAAPELLVNLGPVGRQLSTVIASLGEPVVPALVAALQHPRDEIRDLAADALMKLGPAAAVALPDLIGMLANAEASEADRQQAIGILKSMGPAAASATDLLIRELNDVDRNEVIHASAAEALGAIGPDARRAIPALIDRLKNSDGSGYLQPEISAALVRIDPKSDSVTRALVAAFQGSEDIFIAIGIAEKLCACGPGATVIVSRLIEVIGETSFDTRASLLTILGELGTSQADEVIPLLFERLTDPQEELMVRVAAAKALGKLGPAGVRPIIGELHNEDEANQLV